MKNKKQVEEKLIYLHFIFVSLCIITLIQLIIMR